MESFKQGRRFGSIAFVLLLVISAVLMTPKQMEMHFTDNPDLKGQDERVTTMKNDMPTIGQEWSQKEFSIFDLYHNGQVLFGPSERLNL